MHRLFWNEESKQKVDIQRTFLYKVQNLKTVKTRSERVKTAQENLKWQRPNVKSKSKYIPCSWTFGQIATACSGAFKYDCWIRQTLAACKKQLAKSRQSLEFRLQQEILVKSRQPGRAVALVRKSHLLSCSYERSNVPGQRIHNLQLKLR